jgi:hypothetical protein
VPTRLNRTRDFARTCANISLHEHNFPQHFSLVLAIVLSPVKLLTLSLFLQSARNGPILGCDADPSVDSLGCYPLGDYLHKRSQQKT